MLVFFALLKIQDIPDREEKIKNSQITSNSVTFTVTDKTIDCIKLCRNDERTCDDIDNSQISIKKLTPNSEYKFLFWSCGNHNNLYKEFNIRTLMARKYFCFLFLFWQRTKFFYTLFKKKKTMLKFLAPGPITNHSITNSDEIIIEWYPPINTSGIITHYLIGYVLNNETYSVNIAFHENKKTEFHLPHRNGYGNLSIRAINNIGPGRPVYINLNNSILTPNSTKSKYKSYIGISISIALSIVCICICIWIIFRNRKCVKYPRQMDVNGAAGGGHRNIQNRSSTSKSPYSSTVAVTADNCLVEVHEMQTLIAIPNGTILNDKRKDDLRNKYKNGNNKMIKIIDKFDGNSLPIDDCNDDYDLCRKGLIDRKQSTELKSQLCTSSSSNVVNNQFNHSYDDAISLINTSDTGDGKLYTRNTSIDSTNQMIAVAVDDDDGNLRDININNKIIINDATNDSSSSLSSASNDTISETSSHNELVNDQIDKLKLNNHHHHHPSHHQIKNDNFDNNKKSQDDCHTDGSYFQKSLQKWDYRRPIVGPNG